MPFFSRVFRHKDSPSAASKSKKNVQTNGTAPAPPPKPRWEDAWTRKDVEPEEVQALLRGCTHELKSRALDLPFLLLPFRPASDPSAARTFIRNYFSADRGAELRGERLEQELLLLEPLVLSSVLKWCWSRLPGGIVTWEAYELFKVGEQDSDMARDAFATFIPISVDSEARTNIIFDFFDLIAAIAAHGKTNGMGGGKLSRLAGWWAFEQADTGNGFDGGYKAWSSAADAASHLFFAYLRSLSPDSVRGANGVSVLPRSLQALVQATEYPPVRTIRSHTSKVVMIVDKVSPTPFALLRRAKHFEYRDDDRALQEFSNYEDPVQALTDECRRVLKSISSTNQSAVSTSKVSTSLGDASWSRFEDVGFGGFGNYSDEEEGVENSFLGKKKRQPQGINSAPQTKNNDFGRPTTPSWADFLSSGFVDESISSSPPPLLLPPGKSLPPLDSGRRGQSSQSHRPHQEDDSNLEPGELASINAIDLDEAFWWVWMSSLSGEEPPARKAVFGRCALIETKIGGGKWLAVEEMVKGAAPEPEMGAYIAEKKSRFGFSKRSRMNRTKTVRKTAQAPSKSEPHSRNSQASPIGKPSFGTDQHARIQAAAAKLQEKHKQQDPQGNENFSPRRARQGDAVSTKTNSVFTLQPVIMSEAAPAMKWANTYDKNAVRAAYLGNDFAGRGSATDLNAARNMADTNGSVTPVPKKEPAPRSESYGFPSQSPPRDQPRDRNLPALPPPTPGERVAVPPKDSVPPPPAPMPAVPLVDMKSSNAAAADAAQVPLPATTRFEPPRPPPAPMPATPFGDPQAGSQTVNEAAEIPLPATTPLERNQTVEEKPLPPVEPGIADSPNLDSPQQMINGAASTPSSPESKRSGKKLKKKEGGFKLFGKKKQGPTLPAPPQAPDSAAVFAARAALQQGPAPKSNYVASAVPPSVSQTSLGRRFSAIGRKKSPKTSKPDSPAIPPMPDHPEHTAAPVETAGSADLDRPAPINDYRDSQASLGRVSTNDEREAEREFKTFDSHGPMTDTPAFVPEDSPDHRSGVSTPVDSQHPDVDNRSSVSEIDNRPPSPAQDRWAQIRKNAAERAARQSEEEYARRLEQSRKSEEDGGGETSSEETIESRVARIKARVAELTGNMDGPGSSRGRP